MTQEGIEKASEIVKNAFGRRPDFPSGKDYVDEVRGHISRQEEIREGILQITKSRPMTYQLLRFLRDNGVVIKVEGEQVRVHFTLTGNMTHSEIAKIGDAYRKAYSGLVAVESLVEEKLDGSP